MRDMLEEAIAKFNERAQKDRDLQEALEGKVRTVSIDVTDSDSYNFTLKENRVDALMDGSLEKADIRVTSDRATMEGILRREIKPLKAYVMKKVRFEASLEDLITLRKFFK